MTPLSHNPIIDLRMEKNTNIETGRQNKVVPE
jgi:hypothetical protein